MPEDSEPPFSPRSPGGCTSRSMKDGTEGDMNCGYLAQEVSDGKNISK